MDLDPGEDYDDLDAGISKIPASLGDRVWDDEDEDGEQDAGEPGVDGITVYLYKCGDVVGVDAPLESDVTANGGFYEFTDLDPDMDYFVVFDITTLPAGYEFTMQDASGDEATDSDADPTTGETACVDLDPGEDYDDLDAGISKIPASLGDKVWEDLDGDGEQDAGEPGVDGVTVSLYECGDIPGVDAPLETDVTANGGIYGFDNLDPDTDYFVVFDLGVLPYVFTSQDASGDEATDSDADALGVTDCVDLDPGEDYPDLDAGIVIIPASLGDKVWDDQDQDGEQDPGEPGVDGVTVYLYKCGDVVGVDAPQESDVTAGGGIYGFDNLDPNMDYFVVFDITTLPAGYVFTSQDAPGNEATDSDADATTGETACVDLDPGEDYEDLDAGIYFDCIVDAGTLSSKSTSAECASPTSTVTMVANPIGNTIVPAGYQTLYVLTTGANLVIQQTNSIPEFTVSIPGIYTVHTLVYDPATLDLSGVVPGVTTGFDIKALTIEGGGTICADLDEVGAEFLVKACAELGDKVWDDLNGDGIQDPNEPGVDGVKVYLYRCKDDPATDAPRDSMITANGGMYLFTDLIPFRSYRVVFVSSTLPSGYVFTNQDQGADDDIDSDANGMGITGCYPLGDGESELSVDAGIIEDPCSNVELGGEIGYNDVNCEPYDPSAFVEITPASGGNGPIEYRWFYTTDYSLPLSQWTMIPGASGATYDPPFITETTWFVRQAKRTACNLWKNSNLITVEINPNVDHFCEVELGNAGFNVILFGLGIQGSGISEEYVFAANGGFTTYDDGTAKFEGTVINTTDMTTGWHIVLNLSNRSDWMEWNSQFRTDGVTPRTYRGNGLGAEHATWDFYEADSTKSNTLTGFGYFDGDTLELTHAPADYKWGFQVGMGANGAEMDYGIWGWFNYTSTNYNGKGDIMGVLNNCEEVCPSVPRAAMRILLEGAQNAPSDSTMTTVLQQNNLIPLQQPYNVAPYNYAGTEAVSGSMPDYAVDWVLGETRLLSDLSVVETRFAAILDKNGWLRDPVTGGFIETPLNPEDDSRVFVVVHRNHIGVMTAGSVVKQGRIFLNDFTQSMNAAYEDPNIIGQPMEEVAPGVFALVAGDNNRNGVINSADILAAILEYFNSGYLESDIRMNGVTNSADLLLYNIRFYREQQYPQGQ